MQAAGLGAMRCSCWSTATRCMPMIKAIRPYLAYMRWVVNTLIKHYFLRCPALSGLCILFFCHPALFAGAWQSLTNSLLKGGLFCGHFMGPNDTWAKMGRGDLSIHAYADIQALFNYQFQIIDMVEHNQKVKHYSGSPSSGIFTLLLLRRLFDLSRQSSNDYL
jgi:hypothetical protein